MESRESLVENQKAPRENLASSRQYFFRRSKTPCSSKVFYFLKEFAAREKLEIVKVQDFGSLLRKASDGQAEFLAKPPPPQAAKCVRTILRIDHQTFL